MTSVDVEKEQKIIGVRASRVGGTGGRKERSSGRKQEGGKGKEVVGKERSERRIH